MVRKRDMLKTLGFGFVLAAVAASTASAVPPSNDSFASAQVLTGESGVVSGTNVDTTSEPGEPSHGGGEGGSVWYSWTAPSSGTKLFETCGSGFDTVLAAYTGATVSALRLLAANDDACDDQSRISFTATAGTTYAIAVDTFDGETGPITLRWQGMSPPRNDNFATPQALTGATGVVRDSTLGASLEPAEGNHGGASASTVWFSWTAPLAGLASFDTCGSSFDTVLAVYTGEALPALTALARDDDTCRSGSRVRFVASSGTTYRIAIGGSSTSDAGAYVLSWAAAPRPSNDVSTRPRLLGGVRGSVTASNVGAITDANDYATLWFRWRAPRSMAVMMDTCSGATFDTVLIVYRGRTLRGAVPLASSDDACANLASRVAFLARKGADYLVAVAGLDSAWGGFTLRWSPAPRSFGRCTVPSLRGRTLAQSRVALEQAGCTLGRTAIVRSGIVPRGRVVAQFPAPGARLPLGGRVNVEISG